MHLFILLAFYLQRLHWLWWKVPDGLIAAVEANYANLSLLSLHNILLVPLLSAIDGAITFLSRHFWLVWICPWLMALVTIFIRTASRGTVYFISNIILFSNFQACGCPCGSALRGLYNSYIRSCILLEMKGANMLQQYSKTHKIISLKYCLILFFNC